jgi:two-component system, response regulator PdtaR
LEGNQKKILIVEDEVIVAMEIEMLLKAEGFEIVDKVHSSERAIETAKTKLPDLILMDINIIGESDGIATAKTILSFSKPAIIFLTAYNDSDTIQRANQISESKLLMKPFIVADLLAIIEDTFYDKDV